MSRLHLGIRSQLLTITVVPFLLLTLLLIIVIYRSHVLQTQAALVRQGNLLAAQLAANLEYALSTGALEQIPHAIEATVQPALTLMEIPVTAVTVRDHQQQVLVSQSLPQRTSPSLLERQIVRFLTLDDLRFTANVYLNPLEIVSDQQKSRRLLGEVELHLSIIPLRAEQLSRLLSDLGLLFLAVLLASALALGVGQRLVSAIRTAAQAIRRIEAGDLSARVQKTDHTEIGTLQNGINMLAETVGQAQTRLEHELAKVRAEYEQTLQALQVQTQRAADASQAKSRFLASVSHDLRTPLYTIQALAEQLVRSKQPAPQDSRQILAATQTLLTIINEILDFAQLEEGRYQTSCEPFDPWSELEIMTDALEWRCREQQLYLDLVVADNPGTVRGDVKAFRAIAHNLISNAIHYTTQGGVTITLSTLKQEENQDKDGIRLTVADTGCGIPQSRQQDIFRPFEQLNGSLGRHHTGRGLGLSIVQHFCELIGATITLDSTEGQGTVFTVELPLQRYIDESATENLNADCTVLVVDRRTGFCDSLRSRLTALGATVVILHGEPDLLTHQAQPAEPFNFLLVCDIDDTLAHEAARGELANWAQQVISLETGRDETRTARLEQAGIRSVWCGVNRALLAEMLQSCSNSETELSFNRSPTRTAPDPDYGPGNGKCILVVEDFAINRAIMTRQLNNHGFEVITAADGDNAIVQLQHKLIDLILMDIQMPGKDGLTTIREIRGAACHAQLPIIGFTASADRLTHQRIIAAGAQRVLTKPISEIDLVTAVCHTLEETIAC